MSHIRSYNWRNNVRSSSKDAQNSKMFMCRLNAMYKVDVLAPAVNALEARAAVTGNALTLFVVLMLLSYRCVEEDRRTDRQT